MSLHGTNARVDATERGKKKGPDHNNTTRKENIRCSAATISQTELPAYRELAFRKLAQELGMGP